MSVPPPPPPPPPPAAASAASGRLDIDGVTGGGQILRNALAYSGLTGRPVAVRNIRGARKSGGGLKRQHLAGVLMAHSVCGGELTGAELGSRDVSLTPSGPLRGGLVEAAVSTAGSCTLLAQSAFPLMLFAEGTDDDGCNVFRAGGATDTSMSPPMDYVARVFLPHAARFGARAVLEPGYRRGGMQGHGGGTMELRVERLAAGRGLTAVELLDPGVVRRVGARVFVTPCGDAQRAEAARLKEEVEARLRAAFGKDVEVAVEAEVSDAAGPNAGVTAWAETDTGCLLGGTALRDSRRDVAAELASRAVREVEKSCRLRVCVDEHMQDQVVVLAALAEGTTRYLCGPLEDHTVCALKVAEDITGCRTRVQELPDGNNIVEIEGVGFNATKRRA